MYGIILLTRHNVFWILNLFKDIRKAIKKGAKDFELLRKKALRYW
jgi:queuine/archaeosine tRNA-ribosyltransferase